MFGSVDRPEPPTKEVGDKVANQEMLTTDDAKKALRDMGAVDPMELTDDQRKHAERTRQKRRARSLPTFDDIVREAMLNVTKDFGAKRADDEETEKQKVLKAFDPLNVRPTHAASMIRRQKQHTMLEQGTSITASYMQASAFWVGSVTTGLMTMLSVVLATQTHPVLLGIVPFGALISWRSYEAYENVAEDLRFQNQAREIRQVKRAHIAEPTVFDAYGVDGKGQEQSPLEKKRELRRRQEEEAAAALARQKGEEPATHEPSEDEVRRAKAQEISEDATRAALSKPRTPERVQQLKEAAGISRGQHIMLQGDEDDDDDGRRPIDAYQKQKDAEKNEERLRRAAERARRLAS